MMGALAGTIQILLAQAEAAATESASEIAHMTPFSWAYMAVAWLAIIALNVFCFYRLFSSGRRIPPPG